MLAYLLAPTPSPASTEVEGVVYLDKNRNGSRESQEHGIGGVLLRFGEKSVVTDKYGKFYLKAGVNRDLIQVKLDGHSLPPGAQLTTPDHIIVNKKSPDFLSSNFGLWYQPVKNKLKFTSKKYQNLKRGKVAELVLTIEGNKLFGNGSFIGKLTSEKTSYSSQNHLIQIDGTSLEMERGDTQEMRALLSKHDSSGAHTFYVSASFPKKLGAIEEKLKVLKIKLEAVIKKYLKNPRIIIKYVKGNSELKIRHNFKLAQKLNCRLNLSEENTSHRLNRFTPAKIWVSQDQPLKGNLSCGGKEDPFSLILHERQNRFLFTFSGETKKISVGWGKIKKREAKQEKETDTRLSMEASPHLEDSRDLDVFLRFDTKDINELSINGIPLSSTGDLSPYVFHGKPGKNILNILYSDKKGQDRQNLYNLYLLELPRVYFETNYSQYSQKSVSNKFDVNYKVGRINRAGLKATVFHYTNFGFDFRYSSDTTGPSFKRINGQSSSAKHSEMQLHLGYRHRYTKGLFGSPVLSYFLGFQQKEFPLLQDTIIHFPEKFSGFHMRTELLLDPFVLESLSSNTSLSYGFAKPESHVMKIAQEFRISLNHLGGVLGVKPHYTYFYRYGYWHRIKLVLGYAYERDRRRVANTPNARILDEMSVFKLGFAFQY